MSLTNVENVDNCLEPWPCNQRRIHFLLIVFVAFQNGITDSVLLLESSIFELHSNR